MSLINEALKKARDKAGTTPTVHQPLPSQVHVSRPQRAPARYAPWVGVGCSVVVVAVAMWWIGRQGVVNQPPNPAKMAMLPPEPVSQPPQPQLPVAAHEDRAAQKPVSAVAAPPASVSPQPAQVTPSPPRQAQPVSASTPAPASAPRDTPPPTRLAPQPRARPELKISATMVFSESRVAIINGKRAYEGDEIEGATIVAIRLSGVLVRFNGEEYFVRND